MCVRKCVHVSYCLSMHNPMPQVHRPPQGLSLFPHTVPHRQRVLWSAALPGAPGVIRPHTPTAQCGPESVYGGTGQGGEVSAMQW